MQKQPSFDGCLLLHFKKCGNVDNTWIFYRRFQEVLITSQKQIRSRIQRGSENWTVFRITDFRLSIYGFFRCSNNLKRRERGIEKSLELNSPIRKLFLKFPM